MNNLVSLAEAKSYLDVVYADHDAKISQIVGAASEAVLRYIKSDGDDYRDSGGEIQPGLVPDEIKAATLMFIRVLYDGADDQKFFDNAELPRSIRAMLPHRLPTLA